MALQDSQAAFKLGTAFLFAQARFTVKVNEGYTSK